ncbi:hypothetical protein H6G96_32775 [Nostoc sp. FACHB-892]|uniref:hypothetical protein n=1 Tax=Nostoc sp. FACHB-892 TaxID=2692843 RepID=UPI001688D3CA|nr:hypothetical protein [Nostoc sp. FACHB-892]MBD2730962.1 hypothetical protein [Nostoc sp. FACHB-892]
MNEQENKQNSSSLNNSTENLTSDNLVNSISQTYETSTNIDGQDVNVSVSVNINFQGNNQKKIIEPELEKVVDEQKYSTIEVKTIPIKDNESEAINTSTENVKSNPFLNLIKLAIWGLISWFCLVIDDSEPRTLTEKFEILFTLSWIVGLICPNAVVRFGLPNDRQTVSKIYTTLIALTFGFDSQFQDDPNSKDFNTLQIWVLSVASVMICFNILYPEGTILKVTEESNRLEIGCGCLVLALIIVGIIGGLRAVF